MTVTLHVESESPMQLRMDVLAALGLPIDLASLSQNSLAIAAALPPAASTTPAPEEAPKRRKPKAEPQPQPDSPPEVIEVKDDLEPPAFLDRRPEAKPAEAPAAPAAEAPTLEQMREALNKVLSTDGLGMDVVTKMVQGRKQADGKPCQKASQIQEGDRAAVIAECTKLLAGKK